MTQAPTTPATPPSPDALVPVLVIAALLSLAIFITLVVLILRNPHLGSGAKLGWIVAAFVTPFITLVVYLVVSPGNTTSGNNERG